MPLLVFFRAGLQPHKPFWGPADTTSPCQLLCPPSDFLRHLPSLQRPQLSAGPPLLAVATILQRPCCAEEELDSYALLFGEQVRPHSLRKRRKEFPTPGCNDPSWKRFYPPRACPQIFPTQAQGLERVQEECRRLLPCPVEAILFVPGSRR